VSLASKIFAPILEYTHTPANIGICLEEILTVSIVANSRSILYYVLLEVQEPQVLVEGVA
jgi:hypothetical protein